VDDEGVLWLLKLLLDATGKQGVPPGGVISPLLSNLYLNEVDKMLERAKEVTQRERWTAVEYARFADDLVILVDSHPRQQWLSVRKLFANDRGLFANRRDFVMMETRCFRRQRTEKPMAATLKFAPGSTIRWRAKRFVVVDYAGMDSIVARELGKRRLERIPVRDAAPDRISGDRTAWTPDLVSRKVKILDLFEPVAVARNSISRYSGGLLTVKSSKPGRVSSGSGVGP
jgi:hypothetical protein